MLGAAAYMHLQLCQIVEIVAFMYAQHFQLMGSLSAETLYQCFNVNGDIPVTGIGGRKAERKKGPLDWWFERRPKRKDDRSMAR